MLSSTRYEGAGVSAAVETGHATERNSNLSTQTMNKISGTGTHKMDNLPRDRRENRCIQIANC